MVFHPIVGVFGLRWSSSLIRKRPHPSIKERKRETRASWARNPKGEETQDLTPPPNHTQTQAWLPDTASIGDGAPKALPTGPSMICEQSDLLLPTSFKHARWDW